MPNTQQLREQRASVWSKMTEVMDRSGESMTVDDAQTYDRLEAEYNALDAQIERAEKHDARVAQNSQVDRRGVVAPAGVDGGDVLDEAGNTVDDYRAAFELWAKFGNEELTSEQRATLREGAINAEDARSLRNAIGVGTGSAGGFTVPALFRDKLVETLKYYSGVRQEAEVITTDTGADLPWMTNNDTANVGAILGENTQASQQDVSFGTATLKAYMYTSNIVLASLQILQDSALDLNAFLPRKLGERIGRIQNQHFTTGTGTSQPLGLIAGGTAVAAATGNATSFTYDELVNATARLDAAYLGGGNLAWMGSQSALASLRKIKDSQNRPLWQPSLQAGTPDTFLGYRFVLNNDMAAPAANAKSLAFGDFRSGYVVRDVTGVQTLRLTERYADFLQVGFLAFQRSGGTPQDTNAYTVLQNSAT